MTVWIKRLGVALLILVGLLLTLIAPIDRDALDKKIFYQTMQQRAQTLTLKNDSHEPVSAAWGKVSIVPNIPMPMAGYRIREKFTSIHDSLYCRVITLKTSKKVYHLISIDLLLFPPIIKEKLESKLSQRAQQPFLYFSATHTHNGVGGWNDSPIGSKIIGTYNEAWVDEVTEKIYHLINANEAQVRPARLSYLEANASGYVENRIKPEYPTDGLLRGLKITRSDSSKAQLLTFSAHATSISKKSTVISGDFPAALIQKLEKESNTFGLYMAGMVGSHRLVGLQSLEFDLVAEAGDTLYRKVEKAYQHMLYDSIIIKSTHLPLQFGPSQLRISKDWKLRDWVFRNGLNKLKGELTVLELGDIILIGTPCDFSGELYVNHIAQQAKAQNKKVIITSFNGDYIGYITEDSHYETSDKEEVMALNWVGPYFGRYFSDIIISLLNE